MGDLLVQSLPTLGDGPFVDSPQIAYLGAVLLPELDHIAAANVALTISEPKQEINSPPALLLLLTAVVC